MGVYPILEQPDFCAWDSCDDRYWNHGANTIMGNIYSPTPAVDHIGSSRGNGINTTNSSENNTPNNVEGVNSRSSYRSRSLRYDPQIGIDFHCLQILACQQ